MIMCSCFGYSSAEILNSLAYWWKLSSVPKGVVVVVLLSLSSSSPEDPGSLELRKP